jgi:hypothetical protein
MTLELIRILYGTLELARPGTVTRAFGITSIGGGTRTLTRFLGARNVLQGVLTLRAGTAGHRVGGAVDITHAVSMAVLAALSAEHRNTAAVSALIALLLGTNELR